ncbi:hypothetical protein [Bradyrhizobium iriomotense]|uniref:hypothetical protein n=1 Tax=Bradyrhizobium iriomotense TaxID=441950 RepID=UPI001B8A5BEE|nr:hypothetical protein [Bradyrhizobium iriomotense]MBR1133798.1 hypothetical protein [Bradyrhizobium iriomotense]
MALVWLLSVASYTFRPTLQDLAARLSRGENYDNEVLERIASRYEDTSGVFCDARQRRNLLLINLRLLSNHLESGGIGSLDASLQNVTHSAKQLIACSPSESIAWLALYWVEIRAAGFGPTAISYLTQSYHFGPHEIWVQLFRAPLALRAYGFLPDDLKRQTRSDFDDIVGARLFPTAVLMYQAASQATQAVLLEGMCDDPIEVRLIFRRFAESRGLRIAHACFAEPDKPVRG